MSYRSFFCLLALSGRRCFLAAQDIARFGGGGWVDSCATFIDVLNNALFIDHERRAIAKASLFIEDSIVFHDAPFHEVTKDGKRDPNLFCKLAVSRNAVHT